ncbi:MAG TPA: hypothetical protein VGM60_18155 [Pseudonocardia sp.]|jgi:hypothetical protein|uniref:hypothetical protein n=1 Tax=Pseudonocardia sp. TaxID=60912 RepID=UPI002F3F1E36
MIVTHAMSQVLALSDHLQAAGILQTIRRAIFGFLAIIFVIGGIVGFFIGKAFGRRG